MVWLGPRGGFGHLCCACLALIALLRLSGQRTLAKLNAFDFVITIVLGSALATVLLSSSVALAEGVTALGLLIALQYLERLVRSEPSRVDRNGFLHEAMRQERVTADELSQVARAQGHTDLSKVSAIVLETDGALNILREVPTSLQSPEEGRAGGQRSEQDR